MNKEKFAALLQKYEEGTLSKEEEYLVEQWYSILGNDYKLSTGTEEEIQSVKLHLWERIEASINTKSISNAPTSYTPKRYAIKKMHWLSVAALLVGFILVLFYFQNRSNTGKNNIAHHLENLQKTNQTLLPERIVLDDSSLVTLQPGASLLYPTHFAADKREVYLEGEAFFEVTKNPQKQFLVYSGGLTTQVIGTSFTIKPDAKKGKVIVEVKTGKVVVYEQQNTVKEKKVNKNGVIITPNQKVTYSTVSKNFTTDIVEEPLPLLGATNLPSSPLLFFEDAALAEVIKKLVELYGIEIVPENESIYQCHFTGSLQNLSLFKSLNVICTTFGYTYEIKGTKILFIGKGCN